MVKRNFQFSKLAGNYLFPEINRRKQILLDCFPDVKIINLGIGDTTLPIVPFVTKELVRIAKALGSKEGYRGYGPDVGSSLLREKIAEKLYQMHVLPHEIFINDGAKCGVGRLQVMFGQKMITAVQDPTYPVYVDTSVIMGQTAESCNSNYRGIVYMKCLPENNFFPKLNEVSRADLIYFCSPNNPTGTVATKEQLKELVDFAAYNRSIIIYDSAYAAYIRNSSLPKSIYEIEGARQVAIEVGSFSKLAGFTGVRLGWVVVPDELTFDDGTPIRKDWSRMNSTFFNGASNIAQAGGVAVLEDEGMDQVKKDITTYLDNTLRLKLALDSLGYQTYGGENAPFIWVKFPGRSSWEVFEELLNRAHLVTIPGSGFGASGDGYIRFSGFAASSDIDEAIVRLTRF